MTISQEQMSQLESMAEDVCLREKCRLYDIEFVGDGHGRVLRILIDKDGTETGVSIDDCSNVSNGMSLRLDADDVIPGGAYNLEVSSPGLDRKLSKPWHFSTAIGKKVKVRLSDPLSQSIAESSSEEFPDNWHKRKQLELVLQGSDEQSFSAEVDGVSISIPFLKVEKANLVIDIAMPEKPGKKPGKKSGGKKAKKKR